MAEAAEPSQKLSSKARSNDSGADGINKLVDWGMGLKVKDEDQQRIDKGFYRQDPINTSLNQTLGFASMCPMWLYLELKKKYQTVDPRIQLGIWGSAGIIKKYQMGWDTTFPTPGITVEGHEWELYFFFESQNQVMMMGPRGIGSTRSRRGLWQLMRSLYVLVRWAIKDYQQWFDDNILKWADAAASA
ncbi:MAG: hypothetical protein Q9202_005797 [Teloschistes flavicans]